MDDGFPEAIVKVNVWRLMQARLAEPLPAVAACYQFTDVRDGKVLYIGSTFNLRRRMNDYFLPHDAHSRFIHERLATNGNISATELKAWAAEDPAFMERWMLHRHRRRWKELPAWNRRQPRARKAPRLPPA